MNMREWFNIVITIIAIVSAAGTVAVWAGDQRYMTVAGVEQLLGQLEINNLDQQITFLQIKIDQNEATRAEAIYIETLRLHKRALESKKDKIK